MIIDYHDFEFSFRHNVTCKTLPDFGKGALPRTECNGAVYLFDESASTRIPWRFLLRRNTKRAPASSASAAKRSRAPSTKPTSKGSPQRRRPGVLLCRFHVAEVPEIFGRYGIWLGSVVAAPVLTLGVLMGWWDGEFNTERTLSWAVAGWWMLLWACLLVFESRRGRRPVADQTAAPVGLEDLIR
jgi:hypothetical protein